ncbi:MAG: dihydrolipoyl dehydrogenase [Lachnospiraceae bacterium]|nr:dihydrolipoyl dehydrogenase [Lachnospiraceae bacterium]
MGEAAHDILIIGGGPGGYTAALKAAMMGAKTVLIEKDQVGGTCLNRGCIPTKALLQSAERYQEAKGSSAYGVRAENVALDMKKVDAFRKRSVKTLVKGIEYLINARKVELVRGEASFRDAKTVLVHKADGTEEELTAKNIIIAAGSEVSFPPIPGIRGRGVITSTEALECETLPESMVIIGGGVIGVEIATAYAAFGVKITILEAMDSLLPNIDREVSAEFKSLVKGRFKVFTGARVEEILDREEGGKIVKYTLEGEEKEVSADKVLVCIGRKPSIEGLGLERAGVQTERGRVLVDENFKTSADGIYCIGDANGKCMLAHAAAAQGKIVVTRLLGEECGIDPDLVSSCIYTDPEIASVGISEEQAKAAGLAYKAGKFNFAANGRSMILGKRTGFVKMIAEAESGRVLGVHMIGPCATELIAECALAIKMKCTVTDIADTIHAHPTVSEAVEEAAESLLGGAIDMI